MLGGHRRQEELWGWQPPAHCTQPGPARVRAEPAAPVPPGRSNGSTLFPHVGQSMTGPELFTAAALYAFSGLADKGGSAAPAWTVLTVLEGDSTSGAGHKGRRLPGAQSSCPLHHLPLSGEGVICPRAGRSWAEQAPALNVAKGNQGSSPAW